MTRINRRQVAWQSGVILCLAFLGTAPAACSADWVPSKPIRLILPYAPGGTTDLIARILSGPLGSDLGQQIVIDNRGGGGGVIAMSMIAHAQPDGYTMGIPSLSAHAANATLLRKSLPYDTEKDFQPVSFIGESSLVLVVPPSSPVQSLEQFISRARETGKPVTFASGGIGLAAHIAGELVKLQGKVTNMTHVAYKGGGPATAAAMGGEVDMTFAPVGSVLSFVRAGKVRALAIASQKRSAKLPSTATMIESGFPGFVMADSWGMLAPAGLPEGPARRFHRALTTALKQADVAKRLDDQGVDIAPSTPEELRRYITAEIKKYHDVIVAANIKVE